MTDQMTSTGTPQEAFLREIRLHGVPGDVTTTVMPNTPEGQWALLAPYVGRPLRDIPAGLIMLFAATERPWERAGFGEVGAWLNMRLGNLPPQERMVLPPSNFI